MAISGKKKPGYYGDGDGLYLQVSASGAKSWVLRYTLNKRVREMGLGSASLYGLAQAREIALGYRKLLTQKIDPIDHRNAEHAKIALAAAQRRSFEQCAAELHALKRSSWKNVKHGDQWINTLATYAYPVFGKKDVTSVSKADVLRALEPIWTTKPETAARVRQRIRAVLDWAAARDYRQNHDPHMWDQISRALPSAGEARKPKHFEACPYLMVNEVVEAIRMSGAEEVVRDAFEFLILTAARTGEVLGARWSEIDFAQKRWVIPAERMKASREHRVPLAPRCLDILARRRDTGSDLVFANQKDRMLSNMVFTMLLRRLNYTFTAHGPVLSFPDYEVSDCGRVRRAVTRSGSYAGKVLKQKLDRKGYFVVFMCLGDGKAHMRAVHQLVAHAFLGPQAKGIEVRHLDGVPTNNCIGNLAYGTKADNIADAKRHGTFPLMERRPGAKLTREQAVAIYLSDEPTSVLEARYGLGPGVVRQIKMRQTWRPVTEGLPPAPWNFTRKLTDAELAIVLDRSLTRREICERLGLALYQVKGYRKRKGKSLGSGAT